MKKKILFAVLSLILVAATIFIACSKSSGYGAGSSNGNGGGTGGTGGTTGNTINMRGSAFSVPNLSVVAGTTVTWINDDNMTHTVTSNTGAFNSGDIAPGGSFSYTFSATGSFHYHCIYHSGMTGSVTVTSM